MQKSGHLCVNRFESLNAWKYIGFHLFFGLTPCDQQIVGRVLNKVQSQHGISHIEDYPEYLLEALIEATNLVGPVKCYNLPTHLSCQGITSEAHTSFLPGKST